MRGSSTETFKPNLLSPEYRKQFANQAGRSGFVKALVTGGKPGDVCAYQPKSLAGTVGVTPTQTALGKAGQ